MIQRCFRGLALAAVAAMLCPGTAAAQKPAATVASTAGVVEVQRGGRGDWQPLAPGSPVSAGDVVRTPAGGLVKLLFHDDVIVNLGSATVLRLQRYTEGRSRRALLRLDQGALEALVSGYSEAGARFEVETPTAVIRVQSTDFIVRYDPDQRATDVLALAGSVAVQGTTAIIGPAVVVRANETTRVPADGFPSPAAALEPARLVEYRRGLRWDGTGLRHGLDTDNPLLEGRVVAAEDRPGVGVTAAAPAAAAGPYLKPDVPGQTLLQTLSPDMRAQSQPLPPYRRVKPDMSPVPPR